MHLTLIHNPSAGTDAPAADELVAFLEDAGHTVSYVSTLTGTPAVGRNSELLVAAGGDGTLKKVFAMASHRPGIIAADNDPRPRCRHHAVPGQPGHAG